MESIEALRKAVAERAAAIDDPREREHLQRALAELSALEGESRPDEQECRKRREPRRAGTAKDKVLYMADDFDAPLDDFNEYME